MAFYFLLVFQVLLWRRSVVVITTAQLHSTKPEIRFCAGPSPASDVWEICDGEDLWQWSRLEIKLNALRRSTIPQKQFIIFIIITSVIKELFIFYLKKNQGFVPEIFRFLCHCEIHKFQNLQNDHRCGCITKFAT